MARASSNRRSLARAAIGVLAAYALALQALLVVLAGAAQAAASPAVDHAILCSPVDPSAPEKEHAHVAVACCVLAQASWGPAPSSVAPERGVAQRHVEPALPAMAEAPTDLASLIRPLGSRAPPRL